MNQPSPKERQARGADLRSAVSPACGHADDGVQFDDRRLQTRDTAECDSALSHSELLILPDGRILVHNLTPAFADLLHELNPDEMQIAARIRPLAPQASRHTSHELPD